jgi:hypothetical protein
MTLGADIFSQRGLLSVSSSTTTTFRVPIPPKAIISSSAHSMMAALEFRFVFNLMHHMTRHVKLAGDNPETRDCRRPLVCFLACTTDAASANFLLVSHLMWSAAPSFLHAYLLLVLLLVMLLLLLLPLSPLLRHCGCCLPPAPTAVAYCCACCVCCCCCCCCCCCRWCCCWRWRWWW